MTLQLDTVIRTYVKNQRRLDDLHRMMRSWLDKRLHDLGNLYILDDFSPMSVEVYNLVEDFGAIYFGANGISDTKNGLAKSFEVTSTRPLLCCVDDAVFGNGIKDRLVLMLEEEIPQLGDDWGIIGTFACYEEQTRNPSKVRGTRLWEVPNNILYALVGHVFSEPFSKIIVDRWNDVLVEKAPYPFMCDDIWVKNLLKEFNYKAYNTMRDYTQHIGINNRTFSDDNTGSDYQSKMFVGE